MTIKDHAGRQIEESINGGVSAWLGGLHKSAAAGSHEGGYVPTATNPAQYSGCP
jgi:hypothetical protein